MLGRRLRFSSRFYPSVGKTLESRLSYGTSSLVLGRSRSESRSETKVSIDELRAKKSASITKVYTPFEPTADGAQLKEFHNAYFYADSASSPYDVRSGTYIDVDEKDLNRFFPEGLSGRTEEEFEFAKSKKWMIRDTSKVLFRLIEETEKRLNYDGAAYMARAQGQKSSEASQSLSSESDILPTEPKKVEGAGFHSVISIPRWTSNNEWEAAKPSITYYGKQVVPNTLPTDDKEMEGFVKTKGPGSLLDTTIVNLLNELKSSPSQKSGESSKQEVENPPSRFPDKVILTGGPGTGKSTILNQAVLFARKRGWLVAFVPNGWHHIHSGPFINPITILTPEGERRTVFDNPFMNKVFLRGFLRSHHHQLKVLPIKNIDALRKYQNYLNQMKSRFRDALALPGRGKESFLELRNIVLGEMHFKEYDEYDEDLLANYDFLKAPTETLYDLMMLGVAFADVSGWVTNDVVLELRQQTQIPVLFAVDDYNTWFGPSTFHFTEHPSVAAELDRMDVRQPKPVKSATQLYGVQMTLPHVFHFLSPRRPPTPAPIKLDAANAGRQNKTQAQLAAERAERLVKARVVNFTRPWQVNNGLCIAAESHHHPVFRPEATKRLTRHQRHKDKVNRPWVVDGLPMPIRFDRDVVASVPLMIKVPQYSAVEYVSSLSNYVQPHRSPLSAVFTWEDILNFRMMTGSNPLRVRKDALPFMLPRGVQLLEEEMVTTSLMSVSDMNKKILASEFDAIYGYDERKITASNESDFVGVSLAEIEAQEGTLNRRFFVHNPEEVDAADYAAAASNNFKDLLIDFEERPESSLYLPDIDPDDESQRRRGRR